MKTLVLIFFSLSFAKLAFSADSSDFSELGYHIEICNYCDTQLAYEKVA